MRHMTERNGQMLQWNTKTGLVVMVALLIALAALVGNFTWEYSNFTW